MLHETLFRFPDCIPVKTVLFSMCSIYDENGSGSWLVSRSTTKNLAAPYNSTPSHPWLMYLNKSRGSWSFCQKRPLRLCTTVAAALTATMMIMVMMNWHKQQPLPIIVGSLKYMYTVVVAVINLFCVLFVLLCIKYYICKCYMRNVSKVKCWFM